MNKSETSNLPELPTLPTHKRRLLPSPFGQPRLLAGSIHPPVTSGHGDEVVLNSPRSAKHVDSPPWSSKSSARSLQRKLWCPGR